MGQHVRDKSLRSAVISGQKDRLTRYTNRDLAQELRAHLAPLLGD